MDTKKKYETPTLEKYGTISELTQTTPGGNVKGGAPIFHLDNFGEMSGILDSSGVESEWD